MSGEVKVSIMFHLPLEMKVELERAAAAEGVSTTAFVRNVLAEKVGFALPAAAARGGNRKYASAEERIAAQRERDKERRALIKNLLSEYRAEEA
jgi:ribosomal protein L14E/L6E/L27E